MNQFRKHYSREEARALLPQIREWLKHLGQVRNWLEECDSKIQHHFKSGNDVGGELANNWVRLVVEFQRLIAEFTNREILIKDLDRGLLDFPAIIAGREVFLCWEKDEEDIEFWHDLDTGYAGRERL
ncbi:MAG: DUF2203 domain-containing protein [Verrucomicrobia subdivision 3 bacterium]|nr:DUF2203 domain-containing protein [Limisphaerales bacterium]